MDSERQSRILVRQLDYIRELEYKNGDLYEDIHLYRKIIKRLMNDLQENDNLECKRVYNKCKQTRTYQSFHWDSSDEE
jgi:hypothetical protein